MTPIATPFNTRAQTLAIRAVLQSADLDTKVETKPLDLIHGILLEELDTVTQAIADGDNSNHWLERLRDVNCALQYLEGLRAKVRPAQD